MPNPDETAPAPIPVYGGHLPPIYSNQFHVSILGGVVRIVFGELIVGGGSTLYPHVVISMTADRAMELSALIPRVINSASVPEPTDTPEQTTGIPSV